MPKPKSKRAVRCKEVNVNGVRRKICWGSNGKIVSNKKVSR
jgi:hypothetical protein